MVRGPQAVVVLFIIVFGFLFIVLWTFLRDHCISARRARSTSLEPWLDTVIVEDVFTL
jgi:hypothetical protein